MSSTSRELKSLTTKVEKQQKEIVDLAHQCSQQPQNIDLQQQLYDKLNQASLMYSNLESLSDQVAAAQIRSSLQAISDHTTMKSVLYNFYSSAKDCRPTQFRVASESLRKEVEILEHSLNHAALLTRDQDTFRAIQSSGKELEGLLEEIVVAGKAITEHPADEALQEHLDFLVIAWEDRVKQVEQTVIAENAVFKPEDIIAADRLMLEIHLQNLQKSATGQDRVSFEMAFNGINKALCRLVETAKSEMVAPQATAKPNGGLVQKGLAKKLEELQACKYNVLRTLLHI